jgi:hypothetical protein
MQAISREVGTYVGTCLASIALASVHTSYTGSREADGYLT